MVILPAARYALLPVEKETAHHYIMGMQIASLQLDGNSKTKLQLSLAQCASNEQRVSPCVQ